MFRFTWFLLSTQSTHTGRLEDTGVENLCFKKTMKTKTIKAFIDDERRAWHESRTGDLNFSKSPARRIVAMEQHRCCDVDATSFSPMC
jgi:hypothetical protein